MSIQESYFIKDVVEVYPCTIGKVFFYSNLMILEVKEGIHVSYENTKDVYSKIKDYFGDKSFGVVSNRVNNYSVEVLDINKMYDRLPNLTSYSVVYYDLKSKYSVEIERSFSKVPLCGFSKLKEAFERTKAYINGTETQLCY